MALEDPISADATTALALRYRSSPPGRILWNDVIAGLLAHRTVRAFKPDALPHDLVPTLVAAAQSAASSSNLQLWSVVAVQDPAQRAKLARLAGNQQHIADAPLILLWVADLARAHAVAQRNDQPVEGFSFLESFLVAAVDAALAAQNAVVAAESLGLGTVYIGALRNKPTDVARVAGLPPQSAVVFGLVVGWPDEARPAAVKPRLPQEAVLHHDAYREEPQVAAIAAYDEDARAFQREQGQEAVGWSALLLQRGRSAAALHGRERLKSALRALGFALN